MIFGIVKMKSCDLHSLLRYVMVMLEVKQMQNKLKKKIRISDFTLVPLTWDFMFKRVFSLNLNLLKEFLICVLKLDVDPEDADIILENVELTKTIKKEYRKTVDILVTLNNNVSKKGISIDVEVNSSRFEDIRFRNVLYHEKIVTTYVESGTDIKNMDQYLFYQLNLNTHKFKDGVGEKRYSYKEDTTYEELTENLKIVYESFDYYTNLYYNKGEFVGKDVIWLALINAKTFKEIEEMSKFVMDEENRNKFIQDVHTASRDKFVLSEWESDKMAELVEYQSLKNARAEGKEETLIDTIKSMIKEKATYKFISKVTGKSIEEIKKIEESMED